MTDIRATRTSTEVITSLVSNPEARITRTATEVVYNIIGLADINVTRSALEVVHSYVEPFANVPHIEIWSGFS
jgi:hypothetical protein